MDKRKLRKKCYATLRTLTDEEKAAQSAEICRLLSELPLFRSAKALLAFVPTKSEPDLSALMWQEFNSDKTWGFSVVEANDTLTFRQVDSPETQLREGDFGIREPNEDSCPKIDLKKIDLVLVPGVGFDPETGARLGRGKGHYDRFLCAFLKQRNGASLPQIIGIAFSQQCCEIKPEAHDVPMDCVLTDRGFFLSNSIASM